MVIKKIISAVLAVGCTVMLASCGDGKNKNSEPDMSVGKNGVGELFVPAEDSEEYSLGSYRYDKNGVKLYYEDSDIPAEIMVALSNYFVTFENGDFEGYKNAIDPDYVVRYDKFLHDTYSTEEEEYGLEQSFDLQCRNLRGLMLAEIYGGSDEELTDGDEGNYKITRIRAELPTLLEGETEESLFEGYFSYLNEVFDMDYYSYTKENSDNLEYLTIFVIAEDDNGVEHKILSEIDIVISEKDGKYYTYG